MLCIRTREKTGETSIFSNIYIVFGDTVATSHFCPFNIYKIQAMKALL